MSVVLEGPVIIHLFMHQVLTFENNVDEENYLLSKLQTWYNNREYVLSLKADHPLVNKTNKAIQEIEAGLNGLYENRFQTMNWKA